MRSWTINASERCRSPAIRADLKPSMMSAGNRATIRIAPTSPFVGTNFEAHSKNNRLTGTRARPRRMQKWFNMSGLRCSSSYTIACPNAKRAAPRPRAIIGWKLGRHSRHAATQKAVAHANGPAPPDCRTAKAPARTSPAAIGTNPSSMALCQADPRQRFQKQAAT